MIDKRAAIINYWVNHPGIKQAIIPGYECIDASDFFRVPGNIMLTSDKGISLFFHNKADNSYKGHYLFGDRLRGKAAKDMAAKMLNTVFTRTDTPVIFGQIWRWNRPARAMTRSLGFEPTGTVSMDNLHRPCVDYYLAREMWEQLPWRSAGCCRDEQH